MTPALLLALALSAAPAPQAEQPPALEQPAAPAPAQPSLLAAAAWCVVRTEEEDGPGCDIGAGVSLVRWRRLSWVAVVGTKTVGTGLAWRVSSPGQQVVAVAVGVVVRYDEAGIDAREVYGAAGVTVSFLRPP